MLNQGINKVIPRTGHESPGGIEVKFYRFFNLGDGLGCVVKATPRPLYLQERPGTRCIGGWVGLWTGLGGCGISCPKRVSVTGPDCANPANCESHCVYYYGRGRQKYQMFFSEGSQAVFARPGKCRLNADTNETGDESYSIRKNRRREFMM